jgi:ribosome recycling factor
MIVSFHLPLTLLASRIGMVCTKPNFISGKKKESQMGEVEKAIAEADLGLTPTNDGTMIRINIPALTEERRKDMLKQCKSMGEEGKVAIRNIRRDGMDSIKKMEKAGDVSEDEMKDGLDSMQKLTDKFTKEIDSVVAEKEKEVAKV